mmetsp:Transcript_93352/g.278727  ORF Transcript_93352/g.278727 Transcript_93352/m.278727 type:complete len:315 (+) Transcript_93352:401-1345(+)
MRHVAFAVEGAHVSEHVLRQTVPALAMEPAVLRVREREMLDQVRDVGHPRVQILIAPARSELQMARDSRHPQAASGIAAPLEGLMVGSPAVRLHFHRPLNPADDLHLVAIAVEDVEAPVCLVQADGGVRVNALLVADLLEVNAIHLDKPHSPLLAVPVEELLRRRGVVAVDPLRHLVPEGGEVLAVAAPACEEVDQGEIVGSDHVIEALVGEAVVRAGPVSIQLLLPIFSNQLLHGLLVGRFALILVRRPLLGLDGHTVDPALGVYGPEPEVLCPGADALLARLCEDRNPKVPALDVVQVHVKIDLQGVAIAAI